MHGPSDTSSPIASSDSTDLDQTSNPASSSMIEELRTAARSGDLDRVEELWMEIVSDADAMPQRFDELVGVATELWDASAGSPRNRQRMGPLLEFLLAFVDEENPGRSALQTYWYLVHLNPRNRKYAGAFAECFERHYPVASAERAFFEASGFASSSDPEAALLRLERLLRFREGAWVYHESGWGVGRVVAVDPFLKQVKVDLEEKPGHKIAIDAIDSILKPLEPESFVVLRHERPEDLARLRDEDPVRLVSLVLESSANPSPLRDIKRLLVPAVIAPAGWTKWWNRAKGVLRGSGYFRVGDRSPYLVERVEKAISYADELVEQFRSGSWSVARRVARQLARKKSTEEADAWMHIRESLEKVVDRRAPAESLEAAVILDRGESDGADDALDRVLQRLSPDEIEDALRPITAVEEQRRVVRRLREVRPEDWEHVLLRLLYGKADSVRNVAVECLEGEEGGLAAKAVSALLRSPQKSPEAFMAFLEAGERGDDRAASEAYRAASDAERLGILLDLLDHLRHRSQREGHVATKDILLRVCNFLETNVDGFFRRALEAVDRTRSKEIYERVRKSLTIPPEVRAVLLVALVQVDPTLERKEQRPFWHDEKTIYCTAEGIARRRDEFREIMEVKLPENFKAIGRAADFGDLSENAEYTSALEERDNLTKRATRMKEELDNAKVLEPSLVTTDKVGVGSRVRLRKPSTGEEMTYAILGPWDGSPESGVLYYRSPLAQSLLGHQVGEQVEVKLPGGSEVYEALSITSFFEEG